MRLETESVTVRNLPAGSACISTTVCKPLAAKIENGAGATAVSVVGAT